MEKSGTKMGEGKTCHSLLVSSLSLPACLVYYSVPPPLFHSFLLFSFPSEVMFHLFCGILLRKERERKGARPEPFPLLLSLSSSLRHFLSPFLSFSLDPSGSSTRRRAHLSLSLPFLSFFRSFSPLLSLIPLGLDVGRKEEGKKRKVLNHKFPSSLFAFSPHFSSSEKGEEDKPSPRERTTSGHLLYFSLLSSPRVKGAESNFLIVQLVHAYYMRAPLYIFIMRKRTVASSDHQRALTKITVFTPRNFPPPLFWRLSSRPKERTERRRESGERSPLSLFLDSLPFFLPLHTLAPHSRPAIMHA